MDWRSLPSLATLRAFEAAARHQNLSQAARELNVTHAAISQHVRKLEEELGEPLLLRQGRGMAVTDAGRLLAESLGNGFATIADGVGQIRRRGQDRAVQISVTPAFASHWLMPRIGSFWSEHPEIRISINPSADLVDLRNDGVDLAVRYGDGNWPGLDAELLTDGEFVVVSHPDLVRGRQVNSLSDLVDLPWVMEDHMMERRRIVEEEGIDLDTVKLTTMQTSDLVSSAVAAGLGVSVQPRSLIEAQIEAGTVVSLHRIAQAELGYYIVTRPGAVTPNTAIFRKWLRRKGAEALTT
ncbi:LysR family transcriptional regulator [Aliiroseovarius sp. PrR006]|uniref:LysR family transcriptional regulator n=1 Tax=Aliiroseovarius sp. PrR006 TaxID=2706883 RepID=UPI0013D24C32|nr:LysR family transcriptional regulator [Aliiroseovarius sp. PrR006]NDW52093.1 LysR family transcriptional regulator [Aliiroseovarius sp. PrR006]